MAHDSLVTLNDERFESEIKSGVVLVDFWAPWCGPCRMQTPIMEEVASKLSADKATIAKVNIDEAQQTAASYGVRSIPTLILFKDGQKVKEWVGVRQAPELISAIEEHSDTM